MKQCCKTVTMATTQQENEGGGPKLGVSPSPALITATLRCCAWLLCGCQDTPASRHNVVDDAHRLVAVLTGYVESRLSHGVLHVHVGHMLDQVVEELRAAVDGQPVDLQQSVRVGHRREPQTSEGRGPTHRRQALVVADVDVGVVLQESAHALFLSGGEGAAQGEGFLGFSPPGRC